jgi:hypothetical protein
MFLTAPANVMITAFHPYSTVEVLFVPVLVSVAGEKVFVAGEKRNARGRWCHWGDDSPGQHETAPARA